MRQKIIIDTDPAIGYPFRDVDDALAIIYLLAFPDEIECLGITAVHGNASVNKTYRKAQEILRMAGREDIPVFLGAKSRVSLGQETFASTFLKEMARAYPGEVTVLTIGPLTNIATAGIGDTDFFQNLNRIVMMGGTFKRGIGIPPLSPFEFNFFKDPIASEVVLGAPCKKFLISADLCQQVIFTEDELNGLCGISNRIAGYLSLRIRPWFDLNRRMPFLPWKEGFVPWDLVAAVFIRKPEIFSQEKRKRLRLLRGVFYTGALVEAPERECPPVSTFDRVDPRVVIEEFLESVRSFRLGSVPHH